MTDSYVTWDAAYVLGSLSSEERRAYEAHLKTCASCRAAVAELSGIPALLGKIGPDAFTDLDPAHAEPPAELLDTLLDKVRARRRRTRWLATAAVGAAAAVLAVGLVLVIRPTRSGWAAMRRRRRPASSWR